MEIWKDIKGYEGIYQVSSFGRIKSLYRKEERTSILGNKYYITRYEKILKLKITKYGYIDVGLSKNNIKKSILVHKLVLSSFFQIPNINNLQINHKDGNKKNNNLDNLEYVTAKENTEHAILFGLRKPKDQDGIKNHTSKLTELQVIEIRKNGKYDSYSKIAKKYNVDAETISNVLKYKTYKNIKLEGVQTIEIQNQA